MEFFKKYKALLEVWSTLYKNDFEERLVKILKSLDKLREKNNNTDYLKLLIKHIIEIDSIDISFEDLQKISRKADKEKEVMNIIEELKKEGIEIDTEKSKKSAKQGIITLIEIRLINKFNSIPDGFIEKLKELSELKLKEIANKSFEVEDIKELEKYLNQ